MSVSFFTKHPLSIKKDQQVYKLNHEDRSKIYRITVLGGLFFGIGALIAFSLASYYFRNRRMKILNLAMAPETGKPSSVYKKVLFENKINYLDFNSQERAILLQNYQQAVNSSNPQQHFSEAVEQRAKVSGGWTPKQVEIIKDKLITPLTTTNCTPPVQDKNKNSYLLKIQEMDRHLKSNQKELLINFYDLARNAQNPQIAFENLVDNHTGKNKSWGLEKAKKIKENLAKYLADPLAAKKQLQDLAKNEKLVCFYKTGLTEFLGNFAPCPVKVYGKIFPCSEAAFQWRKYDLVGVKDKAIMDQFFTANGEEAFQLKHALEKKYPNQFDPNWKNGVRDVVMWEVLNAKFTQNNDLKELLEATKGSYLLEHNQAPRDDYWSDNHNGTGKNMLGKMLMAIRDKKACPLANDTSDQKMIEAYADRANHLQQPYFT